MAGVVADGFGAGVCGAVGDGVALGVVAGDVDGGDAGAVTATALGDAEAGDGAEQPLNPLTVTATANPKTTTAIGR